MVYIIRFLRATALMHCLRRRKTLAHIMLCFIILGFLVLSALLHVTTRNHGKRASALHTAPWHANSQEITKEDLNSIRQSLPRSSEDTSNCTSPNLPLYNKFIRDNRPQLIPADLCDRNHKANWLHVSQSKIYFKPEFAIASCTAEPIVRVDDLKSDFGSAQQIHNGSELPSLGFRATCKSQDGRVHKSVYYGIKQLQFPTQQQSTGEIYDNIIILGMDSISRLESLRSLHQVSDMMQSKLNGVTLKQYNILGDGTPAALLPILTGVREEDMPEGRRGFKSARHLDESMRWIFQDLKEKGFLTLHGEEGNRYGTFQLRFLGFKKEPVHFYLRPVLQQQEILQTDRICIGNEISSTRMLQSVKDLFTLYPNHPKFSFLFFAALSHENKDLSPMDSELRKFVEWFVKEDLIRNTSIILMSDHGQRHGPMRNSMQGKLEESLPLMTIALSRQLMSHRSDALKILMSNANRLTTPVDIHKTLLSVAGIATEETDERGEHNRLKSYSLIDQIVPETRSCSDAGIPTHWCSCLHLTRLTSPHTNQLAVRAAHFAVSQMNKATDSFRHLCQELLLESISDADISLASIDLTRRERHIGADYFAHNKVSLDILESGYITVRIVTVPNNGLYDATVQFALRQTVLMSKVDFSLPNGASRINKYGNQSDCIAHKVPHLRNFCFCKSA